MGAHDGSSALLAPLRGVGTATEDLRRIGLLEGVDFAALDAAARRLAAVSTAATEIAAELRDLAGGGRAAMSGAVGQYLATACRAAGAAVDDDAARVARVAGRLHDAAEQARAVIAAALARALDAQARVRQPHDDGSAEDAADAGLAALRSELERAAVELTAIWDQLARELRGPAAGSPLGETVADRADRSTGVRLAELPDGPPAPAEPATQRAPEWVGGTWVEPDG